MKAMFVPAAFATLVTFAPLTPSALAQDPAPVAAPATTTATSRVPAALQVLVPDDASVFAMVASLDELEATGQKLVDSVMPGMGAMMVNREALVAEVFPGDFDLSAIDATRPIGFALRQISVEADPGFVVMIPTEKPDTLKQFFAEEGAQLAYKGSAGYLAVTEGETFPTCSTTNPLIERLPAGSLAVASDLDTIFAAMDPMIALGMSEMRMQIGEIREFFPPEQAEAIAGTMELYYDMLEGTLASVTGADVGLAFEGDLLDLRVKTHFRAGSPMAQFALGGSTGAERYLSVVQDDAIGLVLGADQAALWPRLMPHIERLFGLYPEPLAEGMQASMQLAADLYTKFGNCVAGSGGLGENGLYMTAYFEPADMEGLLAEYRRMMDQQVMADFGFQFVDEQTAMLGDVELHRFTYDFDPESLMSQLSELPTEEEAAEAAALVRDLYGEQLVFTLAQGPELGLFQVGGSDDDLVKALQTTLGQRGTLPELARLGDLAARANPFFVERIDIMALADSAMTSMTEAFGDEIPGGVMAAFEGQSAPMTLYMGFEETSMTKGVMVDTAKLGRAVMGFMMVGMRESGR